MNKLFVFDLDDTLIDNVHDYAVPILDSCRVIIETLKSKAPHVSKIIALENEIDTRRVKEINPSTGRQYLWSMDRFPGSLVETYREICRRGKVTPVVAVEEKIRKIGFSAFDEDMYQKNINPHAIAVLDFLKQQGDTLWLCTKGEVRVQEKKIAALEARGINHFTVVRIVNDKTPQIFAEMVRIFGQSSCFSVGNSYPSDIEPALAVGLKGIYIPVETWEVTGNMEAQFAKVDRERCIVFSSLEEIKTQYGKLV